MVYLEFFKISSLRGKDSYDGVNFEFELVSYQIIYFPLLLKKRGKETKIKQGKYRCMMFLSYS